MAFYWGQGVGLPRIPPAFLLHPNTLKGPTLCNFGFMCCFSIAPSGKPRQISPFSFSVILSILQIHQGQTAQAADRSEIIKNRDRQTEISSKLQSAKSVSFAGVDKGLLKLFKTQKPDYILLGKTGNGRDFVYSVFNFSAKAKALFIVSFA